MRKGIAYLPYWPNSNPYQRLLYSEIESAGIPCKGIKGEDFTFQWLWSNRAKFRYMHLHWLYGVYDSQKSGLSRSKAMLFIIKLLFSRVLGYKLLWTVHNLISHEPSNMKLEVLVRKITARLVNQVIVHCDFAKSEIRRLWGLKKAKIAVIPHGSYVGHYSNNVTREEARNKLGIDYGSFVFLFFGVVRGYKGINQLVAKFREINKQFPEIKLVIAGHPFDENIKQELERIASDVNILLHLHHIPDEEVQFYFNAADIVVFPYLNVLTSGGAMLALSFGKPVIAPAKGCLPELIDEEIGFTYNNTVEFNTIMQNVVRNADIGIMGKKSMNKAKALAWNRIVANYYSDILNCKINN